MPWQAGVPRPREPSLAEQAVVDWNQARIETQKHLAQKYALENQITRAEVLKRTELAKGLALIVDAFTSRIMAADMDRKVKEDILKDLASWPLVLEEVAHGQSRLETKKETQTKA